MVSVAPVAVDAREKVVQVATPLTKDTGAKHSGMLLPLLVKVTVPLGANGPLKTSVTVAVRMTGVVDTEGFGCKTRAVVVAVLLTAYVN